MNVGMFRKSVNLRIKITKESLIVPKNTDINRNSTEVYLKKIITVSINSMRVHQSAYKQRIIIAHAFY